MLKDNNQEVFTKTSINWYPGHMAKTKRLIKENINLIDIIYEVIDSRIPYSSMIPDLAKITRDKQNIIVFNKYDLCDKDETGKWIEKYNKEGYITVTCDSKNTNDYKKCSCGAVAVDGGKDYLKRIGSEEDYEELSITKKH